MLTNTSKWFVLTAMVTAFFTVCCNTTALINALPVIAGEMHVNVANLSWLVNGYVLAAVSLITLSGKLGDNFNKKKIFLFGAFGYLLCSIIAALSWNQFVLIFSRVLQGIFAAFLTSSTLSVIKVIFTGKELEFALAIWTAIIGVGNAIGPFVGGFVSTYLGWHYIFWLSALLISFSIAVTFFMLHSIEKEVQKTTVDVLGAILLTLGLSGVVFALIQSSDFGWSDIRILSPLIIGLLILAVFKKIETNRNYAIVNFNYFKNKLFSFACVGILITVACSIIIPYFLNFYLQNGFLLAFSPAKSGALLLPFSFSILSASLILSFLRKYFTLNKLIFIFLISLIVGLFCLAIGSAVVKINLILFSLIITGFSIGIIMPLFSKMALSVFSKQDVGQGSGLVNTVLYLGDLFAVTAGSIVFYLFGNNIISRRVSADILVKFDLHALLNTALIGDAASREIFIKHYPNFNAIFVEIAQHTIKAAFSNVIFFVIAILFVYTLVAFYLLSKEDVKN